RFSRMASKVWGVPMDDEHPENTALAGIEAMRDFYRSIGMPVTLSELDIHPEDYEKIADKITSGGTTAVKSYVPLTKDVIMEIFRLAQ
ncbi:MAG: iron-containing alcohol dehydrogenase, partial [Candidatus Ornithomonoglobus sp.]